MKKYPHKQPTEVLRDLIASTPGSEGKWFAAAKDAGLFDVALELAAAYPTDPRTLTRAARDYAEERPEFAIAAGLAALRWLSLGYGYEITASDVQDAYSRVMHAVARAGVDAQQVKTHIRALVAGSPGNPFVSTILAQHLAD